MNSEPARLDAMTDARALGAEHASLLCDRVAEHSRAQLAAFGKARGDFHEDIIDVLLLEEESSASLSAAVTERLASMDARLADLALEYADALRREVDAEVAEHERAVESIDRELAALRATAPARDAGDEGNETMDEKKKTSSTSPPPPRIRKEKDDSADRSALAAVDFECVAAREAIETIYATATMERACVRRDVLETLREEVVSAARTAKDERRRVERVRSRRDVLAAMRSIDVDHR